MCAFGILLVLFTGLDKLNRPVGAMVTLWLSDLTGLEGGLSSVFIYSVDIIRSIKHVSLFGINHAMLDLPID